MEIMIPHGTTLRWRAGSNAFNVAWAQLMKLWVSHIILCGKRCTLNDVLPKLQRCLLQRKWAVSSCSCDSVLISPPCNFTCHTFPLLFLFLSLPDHSHPFLFSSFSFFFLISLFFFFSKIISPGSDFTNTILFLTWGWSMLCYHYPLNAFT